MKTKQTIFYVLIAVLIALAFAALSLAGCEQPTNPGKETVATPTANPPAGTYTTAQTVTLATTTAGASIYYTLDGSTPDTTSILFNSSLLIPNSSLLKAIAVKDGMNNSAILEAVYTINSPNWETVATPTANPSAGTYTSAQNVSLSTATLGASIYYTLDGSTPDTTSTLFNSSLLIPNSSLLKAIATKDGMSNSAILEAAYIINSPNWETAATPTANPSAGTYASAQNVSLSTATPGASIYYTLDGSTPNTTSSLYIISLFISNSSVLKAIATKDGMNDSEVMEAAYTITADSNTVATPTADPQGGIFETSVEVTLMCATPGADIYYTLDGTIPDYTSTLYTSPIPITHSAVLKAIAVKWYEGMNDSEVMSETYTINEIDIQKSFMVTTDEELKNAVIEIDEKRGIYDITVIGSLTMEPSTINSGSTVTLKGSDTEGSITLNGTGNLIIVEAENSLILDNNITLHGHDANTASLVRVSGTLTMKDGSKITGNTNTHTKGEGGGVYMSSGSTFIMEGGEISDNYAREGGGIYNRDEVSTFIMKEGAIKRNTAIAGGGIYTGGAFTMEGGEISYNTAGSPDYDYGMEGLGGGVFCFFGYSKYFVMKGGKIANNTVYGTSSIYHPYINGGGGVYMFYGSFSMEGGEISDNKAYGDGAGGGGVCISEASSGDFIMKNGSKIIRNIAFYENESTAFNASIVNLTQGGGVYIGYNYYGNFIMEDSEISDNTASMCSGVFIGRINEGSFTMRRSKIADNTSSRGHGDFQSGVFIGSSGGSFIMEAGSTITGHNKAGLRVDSGDLFFSCEENTEIVNNTDYGIVLTRGAHFTLQAGLKISGNGGGVRVVEPSSFTMETGAEITGNNNTYEISEGGGVFVNGMTSSANWTSFATFTMKPGAKITNNTADYGGGVSVDELGIFNMEGGEISGNTAAFFGGGVYVSHSFPSLFPGSHASFTKHNGAVIYGYDDGDKANTVTAGDSRGHAVLAGTAIYRDTTVSSDQSLHIQYENGTIVEQTGDWSD